MTTTLADDAIRSSSVETTTLATVERPELDQSVGVIGSQSRSGYVRNLLNRSNAVASSSTLTPEIIRKMRRHYQITSGLIVQSLALTRAEWSIECEDDRIREAMTTWYRGIAFHVHRSMTRALWAGYSPNELVWHQRPDLGGGIFPDEIRDLEPSTCKPVTDDVGTFVGFEQQVAGVAETFEAVYALWIVEGMESGNYYGRSILEAALEPWQDYVAFRAFHGRMLERFGEPVVIARAPAGKTIANKSEIEAITIANAEKGLQPNDEGYVRPPDPELLDNQEAALQVAQGLRHHSVLALPSSLLTAGDGKSVGYAWNLEFLEAQSGHGDDFLNAERETDKRIGRAMFVPDLLSQNTEDVGSNALGQTHKSVWSESVEGRLDDYSLQITAQLLDTVRILNYGEGSAPARLVFAPLVDEERERMWEIVVKLVEKGELPIEARELAERYDLPLLDEAEEIRRREEQQQAVADAAEREASRRTAATDDASAPAPDDASLHQHDTGLVVLNGRPAVVLAAVEPNAGLPEWKLPQSYDPPPFRRELNDREARVGFAHLENGLNAVERGVVDALETILDREHERVLRQLSAIVRKGSPAEILNALGTIEIKAGPGVAKAWADLMADVGELAAEGLRTELAAYADKIKPLGAEGRALFRAYATTSADRALSSLLTETRLQLLNAYTSGVSRPGMAALVGQTFEAYAKSEAKPVRLTTRMLSAKALNHSRATLVQDSGIPLAGAQYSAVLDRRTCSLCDKLDEKVIAIEHTDLARFTPPVHHNCRCVWVWITTDEADFTPTWVTPSVTDVKAYGGLVLG